MNAKKFDHVIALIQAALRHHQPQPWMYEAMALAMQADGAAGRRSSGPSCRRSISPTTRPT